MARLDNQATHGAPPRWRRPWPDIRQDGMAAQQPVCLLESDYHKELAPTSGVVSRGSLIDRWHRDGPYGTSGRAAAITVRMSSHSATGYTMRIEIICTGDEVLTGKIVNTNFSYMSQKLEDVGLPVPLGHDRWR